MEISKYSIQNGYRVSFEVNLDRREWEPYLSIAAKMLQRLKPVKGFRAGTAPLGVAEAHSGKLLYNEAGKKAADDGIQAACLEHRLTPVSEPRISTVKNDASGYAAIISFDTYPEMAELTYKGATIERPVHTVTEEDVEEDMEAYVRGHLKVAETEEPARMNDIVEIDFRGTRGGEGFPFDHAKGFREILGTEKLFTGLDAALVGKKKGDSFAITLTMPEDFHRAEIAGFTVDLHVDVRGVWSRSEQTLSDEFVAEYVKDANTVEEFRALTRKKLEERYARRSEIQFKKNVEDALAASVTAEPPLSMVETAIERYWAAYQNLAAGQGKSPDQLLAEEGSSRERYLETVAPTAVKRVKMSLAVDYIIRHEDLTVSPAELEAYYVRNAEHSKMSVEEYKARKGSDETVIQDMLEVQAIQLFIDNANIVDVEMPADQIVKA